MSKLFGQVGRVENRSTCPNFFLSILGFQVGRDSVWTYVQTFVVVWDDWVYVQLILLGRFGLVKKVWQIWFSRFGIVGLVNQIWGFRFGAVDLVQCQWTCMDTQIKLPKFCLVEFFFCLVVLFGRFGFINLACQIWLHTCGLVLIH